MASIDTTFMGLKILKLLPYLNNTEKSVFFCLNSWTSPDNRTGRVFEGIIADNCKLTRRGVRLILRKLEVRGVVKCISTNKGIIFHIVPPRSVRTAAAAASFSKIYESTWGNERNANTEREKPNTEREKPNTEREKRHDNWVQIPHHLTRNNLSGNALAIYSIMLTHNTKQWTPTEIMSLTGVGKKQFYQVLPTLSGLIIQVDGLWKIKDPIIKKFSKKNKSTDDQLRAQGYTIL